MNEQVQRETARGDLEVSSAVVKGQPTAQQAAIDTPENSDGPTEVEQAPPVLSSRARKALAVLCGVSFIFFTVYAWAQHARFATANFDLGIFDQAVRAYSNFQAPYVPLKGFNILADHFHPIVALWAPLYWIWDDPRMLLAAQEAMICISAIPIARFAARRFSQRHAILLAGAYLWSWPLLRMIEFDVHEIAFAVLIIPFLLDALDRRSYRVAGLACFLLVFVREDMGLFIASVGIFIATIGWRSSREGRRRQLLRGAPFIIGGVLSYVLLVYFVIPGLAPDGGYNYLTIDERLGGTMGSAIKTLITSPWTFIAVLFTPWPKVWGLIALGLPTLFAWLASPYVILAAPFIAQRLVNSRPAFWGPNHHYAGVLAPIIVIAAIDAVHRLHRRWAQRRSRRDTNPTTMRPALARGRLVTAWVAWCVVAAVAPVLSHSEYPMSYITSPQQWVGNQKTRDIQALMAKIPQDVCVEADSHIGPHLNRRATVFPPGVRPAHFHVGQANELSSWFIDDTGQGNDWELKTTPVVLADARQRGFVLVEQRGDLLLMKRPHHPVDPSCRR